MTITEDKIANVTDTFYYEGEIVCITRTKNIKIQGGNYYVYYGKFCTGSRSVGEMEYAFFYSDVACTVEAA